MKPRVIIVQCDTCGKRINAPAEYAGKTAKCPQCQELLKIPFQADVNNENLSGQDSNKPGAVVPGVKYELPVKILPYLGNNEKVLFFSRMTFAVLLYRMAVIALVTLMIVLYHGFDGLTIGDFISLSIFYGFFALISSIICFVQYRHTFYILTNCKVIACQGVFNFGIKMMPIKKIEIISINTGVIDRVIGTTVIELSNGGSSGGSIFRFLPFLGSQGVINLKYVKNAPYVVQKISEQL